MSTLDQVKEDEIVEEAIKNFSETDRAIIAMRILDTVDLDKTYLKARWRLEELKNPVKDSVNFKLYLQFAGKEIILSQTVTALEASKMMWRQADSQDIRFANFGRLGAVV